MPWQQISPQYVRQDQSGFRIACFRDVAAHCRGELLLWMDWQDRIVAFQLFHEARPTSPVHRAEWCSGTELRIGMAKDQRMSDRSTGRNPSVMARLTVKGKDGDGRDPEVAGQLLAYFQANAMALESKHRRVIHWILGEGTGVA
jgi:hypothetical protein